MPFGSKKGKSSKREAFVREYLCDFNAGKAAQRAGFKGRGSTLRRTGFTILHDPEVASAIEAAKAERAKRLEITADRVLAEYAKIAFMDLDEVLFADNESLVALNDAAQLIRAKLHAKLRAMALLARHHGIGVDNIEDKLRKRLEEVLDAVKPYMSKQARGEFVTAMRAEMGLREMAPPGGEGDSGAGSGSDTDNLH